jgi:protein-L-isoaspartate(D-aspartate) O-methyltransferase
MTDADTPHTADLTRERAALVRGLAARGTRDPGVLRALLAVPRHEFVPEPLRERAYEDVPLPIGAGQTISQPFIVALMTELAEVTPDSRVLEIGTGCGYQTAILAELTPHVFTIEVIPELATRARETLARLGYASVRTRLGDGHEGWPEEAPFDVILVTAAPELVPPALVAQLAEDGRLVIPVGEPDAQELLVLRRSQGALVEERVAPVRFVPMTSPGSDAASQEPS